MKENNVCLKLKLRVNIVINILFPNLSRGRENKYKINTQIFLFCIMFSAL